MTLLINFFVLGLVGLTIWFFLLKKEETATKVSAKVRIKVDGGYQPSVIEVPVGQPITMEFNRVDPTTCLEEVIIPDFKIKQYLPLNQTTTITITPHDVGEFKFHCGMSMYFGKIKVV